MKLESLLKIMFPSYEGEFYPTGSEVYGYPNEQSDVDFMVLDPDGLVRPRMISRLEELNSEVETSEYFNCIKFPIMDKVINLIFLGQVNYNAWRCSTRAMKAMKKFHDGQPVLDCPTLRDKRLRCKLFQELVIEFGGDDVDLVYEPQPGNLLVERTGGLLFPSSTDDVDPVYEPRSGAPSMPAYTKEIHGVSPHYYWGFPPGRPRRAPNNEENFPF